MTDFQPAKEINGVFCGVLSMMGLLILVSTLSGCFSGRGIDDGCNLILDKARRILEFKHHGESQVSRAV